MSTAITESIGLLSRHQSLPRELIESVIDGMLHGRGTVDEMVQFLVLLQQKGETVDELVGAASAMRRSMIRIRSDHPIVLDTCGTGGDGSQTFNISTAAAIVIAAAGVPVAKHGNRKVTSSTGSADVLAELGINLDAPVEVVERCLSELGLCFCFAPRFHPAMKHVAEARRQISGPTIFNRLGPLCNPASANRQILGVGSAELQVKLAAALEQLGTDRSLVVRGEDGVDEVSLEAPTEVLEVGRLVTAHERMHTFTWEPKDFGLQAHPRSALFADSPAASAACIRQALSGQCNPCRDAVLINAAAALYLSGRSSNPQECLSQAAQAIDTGQATRLIADLARLTTE
ncbi:MAG: anthranilate phosphoribosyltransferase [Aureliella sp.]